MMYSSWREQITPILLKLLERTKNVHFNNNRRQDLDIIIIIVLIFIIFIIFIIIIFLFIIFILFL